MGHRRIAYICGPANHSSNTGRLLGYHRALAEAGLAPDAALILAGNGRVESGELAWPRLAALPDRPTAVFCYNDMTAIGLLRSTRAAGLVVPRDLSIVGFDDISFASFVSPALTTIAQPQFEMGQQAMRMLLTLMSRAAHDPATDVLIQGRLIVRESSDVPRVFPVVN